ncbi:hypothetical protein [Amycolatopsis benzoatilytica]|uniref:hypothetical protein n=1 Tax=Amycolatopsis benzoatilytica TaxID=346045 RepID=UPI00035D8C0D|nr:hypothetical protein [Amycolatopsis benzoatilytica]
MNITKIASALLFAALAVGGPLAMASTASAAPGHHHVAAPTDNSESLTGHVHPDGTRIGGF